MTFNELGDMDILVSRIGKRMAEADDVIRKGAARDWLYLVCDVESRDYISLADEKMALTAVYDC